MKTTLKYNTIESFQRQPAWKKFIDTIVDGCKGLFDDHLIAEFEDGENVTKNNKSISNIKLSESNDGIVPQMDLENLRPKYSVLNYLEDGIPLTTQENISLKGLLRTLSLYGCKIGDVSMNSSVLPHTYKKSRDVEEVENIYGYYEEGGVGHDNPVQAIVDGNSGQNVDGLVGNIDIDDDWENKYDYKENIYGYNQKEPVLTYTEIKNVDEFYWFKAIEGSEHDHLLDNIYIKVSDWGNLKNAIEHSIDIDLTKTFFYESENNDDSCIKKCVYKFNDDILLNIMYYWGKIATAYEETEETFLKWIYEEHSNSFVIIDKASADMYDFNSSDSPSELDVCLQEKNNITKTTLTKTNETIGTFDTKKYNVYKINDKKVILTDETTELKSPLIRKNQIFADECTLKVQPLFVYKSYTEIQNPQGSPKEKGWYEFDGENYVSSTDNSVVSGKTYYLEHKKVSTCANIDDTEGGLNKYTYELEVYDYDNINAEKASVNNVSNDNMSAKSSVYGRYYYKWEQFADNGTYVQDVYTLLKFDELKGDYESNANYNYFFNGYNDVYPITNEDYTNNSKKVIDGYTYVNTYQLEYFETMYFNHFIKVSPIDGVADGDTIKATKLYCDNLELVKFGNMIPYVVSYERKGAYEPQVTGVFDDIDCAIFSKILCYNKHTHLLTVDKEVYFNNNGVGKYVVVAYENLSPFNKISSMNIVAPDSVKGIVAELLENYKNDNKYELNLFTEAEYQEYLESLQS